MSDKNHLVTTHAEHAIVPERMSPVVALGMRMLEKSPDPQTLRELLVIQREWEADEARKAFERAMVALKRDMPAVLAKDKVVDFTSQKGRTRYTHTSLAAAMDAVTGPLTTHGFSLSWTPTTTDRAVSVTCRLTHIEGHHKETTISAPADTSGSKSPAQAVASTITLLSRYTALALLGIATADMVDPEPPQPSAKPNEAIDANRNLRAVGKLGKHGRTREEAEAFLGRPVSQWTAADIDKIAKWAPRQKHTDDSPDAGVDPNY